jgi:hypothetical protein
MSQDDINHEEHEKEKSDSENFRDLSWQKKGINR